MSTTRSTYRVLGIYQETDDGVQLTRLISRLSLVDPQTGQTKDFQKAYSGPDSEIQGTYQNVEVLRASLMDGFGNNPEKNVYVFLKLMTEKEASAVAARHTQDHDVTEADDAGTGEASTQGAGGSAQ